MKRILDMLPIRAFERRGTPVGGRSLRLYAITGYDSYGDPIFESEEAIADAAYQANMAAWNTPPAPAPAPWSPPPEPAAPAAPEAAPAAPEAAPAAPAAPQGIAALPAAKDWTQTVNDIYQQELGRQADPSGMGTFTDLLNQGWTGEQVRGALQGSSEYANAHAAAPAAAPSNPNSLDAAGVNALYQQYLGRDADPTGLNAYTGQRADEIADSLSHSPEYQARLANVQAGRPADAPAVAKWEWQPSSQDEFTGYFTPPVWRDANSGAIKTADPVQFSGITTVDPNTLPQQLAPNYEGTPTQFYDDQGNLKGVLMDMVKLGAGTKEGNAIIDPMSLGLALKPGEKPSINSEFQQSNDQGQMLFIDPITGGTTIYNTGVPALSGITVKDKMYLTDPGKRGGQIPADMSQGALLLAATMLTGGVGGALLEAAGFGAGAAGGLGAGTVAGGDIGSFLAADAAASGAGAASTIGAGALTDAAATNLMEYGLLPEGMQAPAAGFDLGSIGTAAAKQAALNAGTTALKGGSPSDILKSGLVGAVSGGTGSAIGDAGLGSLETTLAKAGTQAGLTALTGGNVGNSLISSAVGAALPATLDAVIPAGTFDGLPPAIQNAVTNATASAITAASTGGNISNAALNSIIKSAANSVVDVVSSKGITDAEATNLINSNLLPANMQTPATDTAVNNSDFSDQILKDVLSRNDPATTAATTAPTQDTTSGNLDTGYRAEPVPVAAPVDSKFTPLDVPQTTAVDTTNPDAVYNYLASLQGASNPTDLSTLPAIAGVTTSDANPVAVPPPAPQTQGTYDAFGKYYAPSVPETNGYVPTAQDTSQAAIDKALQDQKPSLAATFGQGAASLIDNTVGAILPTIAQMASYLGLRTADQVAELTSSVLGKEYQADPDAMREISNKIAASLSNPVGKLFDITDTPGYQNEISRQALQFISENLDKGADYLSEKTGLPAGDVRLMADALLMRPGAAVQGVKDIGTAAKDVGAGYADSVTNAMNRVVDESPTNTSGAYNLGATIADLTRTPEGSPIKNDGRAVDAALENTSPSTAALEYKPTESAPKDVAAFFDDVFAKTDEAAKPDTPPAAGLPDTREVLTPEKVESLKQLLIEPDYEINSSYPGGTSFDQPATPSAVTQRAAEPSPVAPAAFAEPVKPIDLGSTALMDRLQEQMNTYETSGMTRDAATQQALTDLAQSTGSSVADLRSAIDSSAQSGQQYTQTQVANLQSALTQQIAANESSGMSRDQATQKAVTDLAASTGASVADLRNVIASTAQSSQQYTQQQVDNLQQSLTSQISANEASGLSRDQATNKAIQDLAASTGKSDDEIKSLVSGVQTGLEGSVSQVKNNLEALISANESAGLSRDQATQQAIQSLSASTGASVADLNNALQSTSQELTGAVAGVKSSLESTIAANEQSGMARDAATAKAIADLSQSTGTSVADLKNLVSTSAQSNQQYTQAQVANLQSTLSTQISANEQSGMTRDAATNQAITDLAKSTSMSDADLRSLVGATAQAGQQYTQQQVAGLQSSLSQQIAANESSGLSRDAATTKAIADLAQSTGSSVDDLKTLINTSSQTGQQYTQQQITGLQNTLSQQIAANESSGMARDEATNKAIADLAKSTGSSVADLQNVISGVNTNLTSSVSNLKNNLEGLITANETAGLSRDQATQNAIESLSASTGTSVADLKNLITSTQADLTSAVSGLKSDIAASSQAGQQYTQQQVSSLQDNLAQQIASNEQAGMTRDAATNKAVNDVASSLQTTNQNLLDAIGATGTKLDEKIRNVESSFTSNLTGLSGDLSGQIGGVKTDLANTQAALTDKIAANEASGLSRSQATDQAIADLAKQTNMSDADLRGLIGSTAQSSQQYTQQQVADLQNTLSKQIADNQASGLSQSQATDKAVADLAKQTNLSDAELRKLVESSSQANQQYTQQQVTDLQKTLSQQIADNEASGLTRSQATDKAVADLATQTKLTDAEVRTLITDTAESGKQFTKEQIAASDAAIGKQITDLSSGIAGLSTNLQTYQAQQAAAAAAAAKQAKISQLASQLSQTQQVSAKTPPGAEIDYLYDIGGESIFAPPRSKKQQPKEGYYDYYDGGNVGSIDDLYDMLRSK